MKKLNVLLVLVFFSTLIFRSHAQEEIISLFKGSEVLFDDEIGFETHYYLTSATSHKAVDGTMHRQFCELSKDISTYEVIKNYEKAILSKGGEIIHLSRSAKRYIDEENGERIRFTQELFTHGRKANGGYPYLQLPNFAQDYVVGKVSTAEHDIYISVAAAVVEEVTYYELVTVVAEPMDMNNVTLNVLNEGIADKGRIAIYDIYFDTGKSAVKDESKNALTIIADYLKSNQDQKFLIVGHTDNTGDFQANISLSEDRANAVIQKLVSEYGVSKTQLVPYGVGSVSPQMSNSTEDGRTRNRRVELVVL